MLPSDTQTKLKLTLWTMHLGLAGGLFCLLAFSQSLWLENIRAEGLDAFREIEKVQAQMKNADSIKRQHALLSDTLNDLKQRAEGIRARIPDHPNEGEFLKQTTQAAKDSGITISEYRRGEIDYDGDHSRLKVHVSLTGNYASICRFIDRLESLPRLSRIDNLTLSNESHSEVYPVEIILTLFFRAEQSDKRIARSQP
jgi:Tfp pilus assembly protein PilO